MSDRFGAARAAWIVEATARGATDPGTRAGTWTLPAVARTLPDRWVALGYVGGQEICRGVGADITGPVHVGPEPGNSDMAAGLHVDPGMAWMVDYQSALDDGMAVAIEGAPTALDRLIVVGLRGGADGSEGAALLAGLLKPITTPMGWRSSRRVRRRRTATRIARRLQLDAPDPQATLTPGTGPALAAAADGHDGSRLAAALGLEAGLFAHVEGADGTENLDAQAINAALWPADPRSEAGRAGDRECRTTCPVRAGTSSTGCAPAGRWRHCVPETSSTASFPCYRSRFLTRPARRRRARSR